MRIIWSRCLGVNTWVSGKGSEVGGEAGRVGAPLVGALMDRESAPREGTHKGCPYPSYTSNLNAYDFVLNEPQAPNLDKTNHKISARMLSVAERQLLCASMLPRTNRNHRRIHNARNARPSAGCPSKAGSHYFLDR